MKLTEKFQIDAQEQLNRKRFVKFDQQEVVRLKKILPLMEKHVVQIVDEFYSHLLSFDEARKYFENEKILSHVKSMQQEYLLDLCRGNFDEAYFVRRLHIGVVHEKIGLVPKWYIGSYANFTALLFPILFKKFWYRPGFLIQTIIAFIKIMNLDQQLAIDTYIGSQMEKITELNHQLNDGIQLLATSSSQMVTVASQLSTTAQEIKETANHTTQKAGQVSQLSQQAAQVSHDGQQSVTATIKGIDQIQDQMDVIRENIDQLNEQTQTIEDIISSVDDLAEQSNLLSVNAAIEASRAGESGKGFAIVAQEVKSLAEQSREATQQVRFIIKDIQKATAEVVESARRGQETVENGRLQSQSSGKAIQKLNESIGEASKASTQILASSRQQLTGIAEIAGGLQQMEESITNLKNLGKRLQELSENLHGNYPEQ